MRNVFKLPLCALVLTACGSVIGAELRVEIKNVDPSDGRVYFALFDSAATYDTFEIHARARSAKESDAPHAVFSELAAGEYAVAVFQDTNNNRRLDMNAKGIPLEPYGFSRNAVASRGRPEFTATAVTLPIKDKTLTIEIDLVSQH